MSEHKYVVSVPKPHPKAYNPDRPITDLVRNQIMHLSKAEKHLDKRHRTGIDPYSIQTERQASEYIHHLTKKLHPEGAKKPQAAKKQKLQRAKPAKKSRKTTSKRK
jgi:hypothetical protein